MSGAKWASTSYGSGCERPDRRFAHACSRKRRADPRPRLGGRGDGERRELPDEFFDARRMTGIAYVRAIWAIRVLRTPPPGVPRPSNGATVAAEPELRRSQLSSTTG